MRLKLSILLSVFVLTFSACEKAEKLRELPPVPAGIQTQIFGMGENYENQIWFEFSTQKTEINRHDNWDIAFSNDERHLVLVNGGKNANFGVATFPGADFNSFTTIDYKNNRWDFDNPSGETDSLVFKNWCTKTGPGQYTGNNVLYVFDLGDDTMGLKRYIKFKLLSRDNGVYHINWSYMQDTIPVHDEYLRANESNNYLYYNFSLQKEVYNEMMDKGKWDLVFTTYKQWIPDPDHGNIPYPYVLRGVQTNPNNVKVAEVSGMRNFEDIDLDFALSAKYSNDYDEIGYDWKVWNLTANKYTVNQNKIYIVLDSKGNYYKMKFVDFYDDQGRKGYPKMAWELLK